VCVCVSARARVCQLMLDVEHFFNFLNSLNVPPFGYRKVSVHQVIVS